MGMVCNYKLSGKKVFTEKVTLEERSGGDDRGKEREECFRQRTQKCEDSDVGRCLVSRKRKSKGRKKESCEDNVRRVRCWAGIQII